MGLIQFDHQKNMPFRKLQIDSAATPETITERIRAGIRGELSLREYLRQMWDFKEFAGPPFIGSVRGNSFRIRQKIRGRNSFIPMIRGQVAPHEGGSRINVTMFMHPFVFCFMIFWIGALGWGIWKYPSEPFVPAIMILFGLGLSVGCFFWEAGKAERLLLAVLDAKIASEPPSNIAKIDPR
jgi:hypothetical protein